MLVRLLSDSSDVPYERMGRGQTDRQTQSVNRGLMYCSRFVRVRTSDLRFHVVLGVFMLLPSSQLLLATTLKHTRHRTSRPFQENSSDWIFVSVVRFPCNNPACGYDQFRSFCMCGLPATATRVRRVLPEFPPVRVNVRYRGYTMIVHYSDSSEYPKSQSHPRVP